MYIYKYIWLKIFKPCSSASGDSGVSGASEVSGASGVSGFSDPSVETLISTMGRFSSAAKN